MIGSSRRNRSGYDIWPGFVDALATILLVFVFVLLFFVVSQFYLGDALQDRDQALADLEAEVAELADTLAMEREERAEVEDELAAVQTRLRATLTERAALRGELSLSAAARERLAALLAEREEEIETAEEALEERQERILVLEEELADTEEALAAEAALSAEAEARVTSLQEDIQALRDQLDALSTALRISEAAAEVQRAEIDDLGERLNVALAERVEELEHYRSEFFGRLREVLEDIEEIEIDGDRFRFTSELLFDTGSAAIDEGGEATLRRLAETVEEIRERIPDNVDWVLQVEGHTDTRPIVRGDYPTNWELSQARAMSIVHFLIDTGIPPERLAAAGFGEHHPVDDGDGPEAWARNRRIELRLTSR